MSDVTLIVKISQNLQKRGELSEEFKDNHRTVARILMQRALTFTEQNSGFDTDYDTSSEKKEENKVEQTSDVAKIDEKLT